MNLNSLAKGSMVCISVVKGKGFLQEGDSKRGNE